VTFGYGRDSCQVAMVGLQTQADTLAGLRCNRTVTGDRLAGLDHYVYGLSLELRAEPPALPGHAAILSVESHCPRSLVHLKPAARWTGRTVREASGPDDSAGQPNGDVIMGGSDLL
jgi:hypothetical protein